MLPPVDTVARQVHSDISAANRAALDALFGGNAFQLLNGRRVFAKLLLPGLVNIHTKAAEGQSSVDLAVVACALERFRMANGHYPETLEALVPAFLER